MASCIHLITATKPFPTSSTNKSIFYIDNSTDLHLCAAISKLNTLHSEVVISQNKWLTLYPHQFHSIFVSCVYIAIAWKKHSKVYTLGTPFIVKSYHLAFPVAPHCQYHFWTNITVYPARERFSWLISLHTILSEARLFVLVKYSPEVQSTPLPMTLQTSQLDKQNFPPSLFQDDKYDIPWYLEVYIS